MAGEWREVTLSDLAAPGSPITYGVVKPGPEDPNGVLFIRGGDIADGRVRVDQLRTITREVSAPYKRTVLHGGELVVSLVGNPGQLAIVPVELRGANIARQVGLIRLRDDVDARFVKYSLSSVVGQASLDAQSRGSVQQVINLGDLRTVHLQLPPLSEQRGIAHILGTLDDKIELNRRMNETLEAIARALFKSWFVDFDPVHSKAEGRDPGLPARLADLFPDTFEDSEVGEVPAGWTVAPLARAIDVNPARALRRGESAPYLDMSNMPTQSARARGLVERAYGSGMRFIDGDTLVARITPCLENGKTCFVDFLGPATVGWGSTEYIVLRPRPPIPAEFAYCLARTEGFRTYAISNMTGTSGRQRVSAENIGRLPLVIPPAEIAWYFGAFVQACLRGMKARDDAGLVQAVLRDTLLPKLVSGDLPTPVLSHGGIDV